MILDMEYLRDNCDKKDKWVRFLKAPHYRTQLLDKIYKLIFY